MTTKSNLSATEVRNIPDPILKAKVERLFSFCVVSNYREQPFDRHLQVSFDLFDLSEFEKLDRSAEPGDDEDPNDVLFDSPVFPAITAETVFELCDLMGGHNISMCPMYDGVNGPYISVIIKDVQRLLS